MEIILFLVMPIIIFVFVFVYKMTHGYGGRPYSKKVDSKEYVTSKNQNKTAAKSDETLSAIQNAAMTSNLYNLAKGGCGAAGMSGDEEFDEAQYRAYREELAAYDDFVASLDMDD